MYKKTTRKSKSANSPPKKKARPNPLHTLLADTLPNIFSFLDDSSLFHSASLVSKLWNEKCNQLYFWKSRTLSQWPSLKQIENFKVKPWKNSSEKQFWRDFYIAKKRPQNTIYKLANEVSKLSKQKYEWEYLDFVEKLYNLFDKGKSKLESWTDVPHFCYYDKCTYEAPNDQFQFLVDSVVYTDIKKIDERDYDRIAHSRLLKGRLINLKGELLPFKFKSEWYETINVGSIVDCFTLTIGKANFSFQPDEYFFKFDKDKLIKQMEEFRKMLGIDEYKKAHYDILQFIKTMLISKDLYYDAEDKLSECEEVLFGRK